MNGNTGSWRSSIGKKLVVALTGLALVGFLLAHLAGNLLVFGGQESFNTYAQTLRDIGPGLWVVRFLLLALAGTHVLLALRLQAENSAARGAPYAVQRRLVASPAARSMLLTGLLVLAFVLYHLAHFTWRVAHPEFAGRLDAAGPDDVYSMVVGSFGQPLIAGLYLVAIVLLGLHLSHGVSSVFQTLGFRHPRWERTLARVGPAFGTLVAAGYLSIPLAVQAGLVTLPPGVTFP
jgi:succinate dehydrogenase / fumarate reductase cytochrome b subunit